MGGGGHYGMGGGMMGGGGMMARPGQESKYVRALHQAPFADSFSSLCAFSSLPPALSLLSLLRFLFSPSCDFSSLPPALSLLCLCAALSPSHSVISILLITSLKLRNKQIDVELWLEIQLTVNDNQAGLVIGRGGERIAQWQQESGS